MGEELKALVERLEAENAALQQQLQQVPEVCKVSVKLPTFWPDKPAVWFGQVEAQFQIAGITADSTKFNYVVAQLDQKLAGEVEDLITRPPVNGPQYVKLKEQLIRRLSMSEEQRVRQLISEEELGDRRPSQFLRHLRSLAGSALSDENILRQLWLRRLPQQVQAILASQAELSLDKLSELGDKVMEIAGPKQLFSCAAPADSSSNQDTLSQRMERLEQQIAALSGNMKPSRTRQRSASSHRSRSCSRSRVSSSRNGSKMSSVQEEKPPEPAKPVRELRNAELVSRLLAATPPYLYSSFPLQPHSFFFSEMLRSFVTRHPTRTNQYHRRFKRRSHKYFAENDEWRRDWPKQDEEKKEPETRPEVPLELTVDKHPRVREPSPRRLSPKIEQKPSSPAPGRQSSFVDVGTEELPKPSPCVGRADAVPPSNLILPPPPPMWYPPIYNPQFGVDPLNFFIDLRVSGHIYDRKRAIAEGLENVNQERPEESGLDKRLGRDFGMKPRHVSAFSVPVRPGNISADVPAKYFDHNGTSRHGKVNGTSYIMKNLKTVYDNLKSSQDLKDVSKVDKDEGTKAESSDLDDDIID